MVRGLVVVVLIVSLAAVSALGFRWLNAERAGSGEETLAACYPLQEVCRWQTSAGEASVAMTALAGDELLMELVLPGQPDRVIAILSGESMYMGEYPISMESAGGEGNYRAGFVPPFCSASDRMTWRIDLRVGAKALSLPFRLLFNH